MKKLIFILLGFVFIVLVDNIGYSQKTNDTLVNDYMIMNYKRAPLAYIISVMKLNDSSFYTVVSLNKGDSCSEKIKIGEVYKLKLKSYYNRGKEITYIGRHGIDVRLWIENKMILFNTGINYINDIYLTPNLKGLCYIAINEMEKANNKLQNLTISYLDINLKDSVIMTNENFSNILGTKKIIVKDSLLSKEIEERVLNLKFYEGKDTLTQMDIKEQVCLLYLNSTLILSLNGESRMELNGKDVVFDKELQDLIKRVIKQRKSISSK